jgi:Na+-translocating ferredoxin:NAD+ oxidoreductase RNF subunit RnfB
MSIIIPILVVGTIGLLCSVMLVVASKFMAVPEDETFLKIRECLPGANCGACGFTGCDGYAHALADGSVHTAALCVPGGAEVCGKLSEMMQWEEQAVVPKVAYIACCGDNSPASRKHDYRGINTCIAAYSHFAGYAKCAQSCLGIGDCAEVCPNHAICIENGIATVRPHLCEGCGLSAKVCPSRKIRIVPKAVKVIVRCTSNDKGANTRKACDSGCIGCKKCEKVCENDAIHVINNCAEIDYSKCTGCGKCAEACLSGCITTVDFLTMSNMPFSSV